MSVTTAVDGRLVEYLAFRFQSPGTVGIQPLSGDASTRRYFRLRHGGTTSVIALYPEPFDAATQPFLVLRALLAGFGLPVPEVTDHDGSLGVIQLEDLGDDTLQEVLKTADAAQRAEAYREALCDLARLQQRAAAGPRTAACFQVAFDLEKLTWELHYFEKHFLEGHRGCDLSVEDRATLAEAFHRLCEEIASWPRVLCHRDFHSRNLMRRAGRLRWIDFQDARLGPVSYDLASLLRDSYVELPEELVTDLVEEFRQVAAPQEAHDAFLRRFELTAAQRNLKALGTFGYQASVRGNPVYLPYVPRTLRSVRRNLERHPELEALQRVLARHLPELS